MTSSRISFLAGVFAIGLAVLFAVSRIGFGVDLFEIAKIIGMAFFVIFFSELALLPKAQWANNKTTLIHDDGVTTLLPIILVSTVSYIFGPQSWQLLFVAAGYCLFFLNAYHIFVSSNKRSLTMELGAILIFTVGCGALCWDARSLSPIFAEMLAAGEFSNEDFGNGLDTLFHMSITQMIKTHNVPSIGVDGLIPIKYHIGSHFVIAQFSKALNVHVYSMYHLGCPVIFFPAFLKIFLSTIFRIRKSLSIKDEHSSVFFWAILLLFFFGFIPVSFKHFLLDRINLSLESIWISNSYLFSLMVFFTAISVALTIAKSDTRMARRYQPYGFLLIGILVLLSGVFKVSTMAIGIASMGFVFLRLQLFKKVPYVAILAGVLALFFLIQPLVSPVAQKMQFEFFYSYTKFISASLVAFFILYYFLLFITAVLYYRWVKKNTTAKPTSSPDGLKFLALEVLIVIALAGFAPGLLIKIEGGSAFYFSEIQYWVALALLLAIIPVLPQTLPAKVASPIVRKILLVLVIAVIGVNVLIRVTLSTYANLHTRKLLLYSSTTPPINKGRQATLRKIRKSSLAQIKAGISIFSLPVADSLKKKPFHMVTSRLMQLDNYPDKEHAVIFISNYLKFIQNFSCHKYPFIVPAFSGIPTLQGYDKETCGWMRDYGYDDIAIPKRSFYREPVDNVCSRLSGSPFKEIIILKLDDITYEVQRCK